MSTLASNHDHHTYRLYIRYSAIEHHVCTGSQSFLQARFVDCPIRCVYPLSTAISATQLAIGDIMS